MNDIQRQVPMQEDAAGRRWYVLFHGTTDKYLPGIKAHGLVASGSPSVWPWYQRPKYRGVYLSQLYAPWFAGAIANRVGGNPIVVAVRVPVDAIYPDEDYLTMRWAWRWLRWAPAWLGKPIMMLVPRAFDPAKHKGEALKSLAMSGRAAVTGVPREDILGVFTVQGDVSMHTNAPMYAKTTHYNRIFNQFTVPMLAKLQ